MISKQEKEVLKAMPTINRLKKQAKKEAFRQRIIEISRELNFWEKLELIFKIL